MAVHPGLIPLLILWLVVLGSYYRANLSVDPCLQYSPPLGSALGIGATGGKPPSATVPKVCTSLVHTRPQIRLCEVVQKTTHDSSPSVYTSVAHCRPQYNWSPHPIWSGPTGQKLLCTQERDTRPVSCNLNTPLNTVLCVPNESTGSHPSPSVYTSVAHCRPQSNWSPHPIRPGPTGQKLLCTQERDTRPVSCYPNTSLNTSLNTILCLLNESTSSHSTHTNTPCWLLIVPLSTINLPPLTVLELMCTPNLPLHTALQLGPLDNAYVNKLAFLNECYTVCKAANDFNVNTTLCTATKCTPYKNDLKCNAYQSPLLYTCTIFTLACLSAMYCLDTPSNSESSPSSVSAFPPEQTHSQVPYRTLLCTLA